MTTRLELYNAALIEMGHRTVSDTGEKVESARALTDVFDRVVKECLESASWNFATETVKVEADTGIEPAFGYKEVFAKPSDWLRTYAVSGDEHFAFPLLNYYDDQDFWSSDISPMYVRYVSDDTGMGLDFSRWTQKFTRYVELELASRTVMRIAKSNSAKSDLMKMAKQAKRDAMNSDAMNEANPKFAPTGSWNRSRYGRNGGNDRGSRSSLTG